MPGRQGCSALKAAPLPLPLGSACQLQLHLGSSGVFITQVMFPEHLLLPASVPDAVVSQTGVALPHSSQSHTKGITGGRGG